MLDAALAALLEQLAAGRERRPPRFAVIGYGKLGGKELGYASDLDIVFLYDDPRCRRRKRVYTRLAQRLNTWLTAAPAAGTLFDTDLRLRPDGDAGLLVSASRELPSATSASTAWVWEHQALTRARFVAGDAELGARSRHERAATSCASRATSRKLAPKCSAMREQHACRAPEPARALRPQARRGGMVDVEFIVQYLVLAHAHRAPRADAQRRQHRAARHGRRTWA